MAKNKVRVWSYVAPDVADRIVSMAADYGVTKSVMISFAIVAGLNAIERALEPEKTLTPEMWAMIMEAQKLIPDKEE